MLKLKLPGKNPEGISMRGFKGVVNEDIKVGGINEEYTERWR